MVKPVANAEIKATETLVRFSGEKEREQSLRWVELTLLKVEDFNFPIDKHVASILINEKFAKH